MFLVDCRVFSLWNTVVLLSFGYQVFSDTYNLDFCFLKIFIDVLRSETASVNNSLNSLLYSFNSFTSASVVETGVSFFQWVESVLFTKSYQITKPHILQDLRFSEYFQGSLDGF